MALAQHMQQDQKLPTLDLEVASEDAIVILGAELCLSTKEPHASPLSCHCLSSCGVRRRLATRTAGP
eukprot:2572850-Amphidinium_carterae.1